FASCQFTGGFDCGRKRSPKRLKTGTGFEAAQKRKLGTEKRKAFRKEGGAAKTLTEAPGSF
ncbi:MAG: hypothetical protein ACLVJZ_11710, partial [[Clostridium] leptum]